MKQDIETFVHERVAYLANAGLARRGPVPEEVVRETARRFQEQFGFDLPAIYLDICRIEDGIECGGAALFGLITRTESGADFPWTEGLLDAYETQVVDIGEEEFIPFGLATDGGDQYGYDLTDQQFVRIVRHRSDRQQTYADFEDMFRDFVARGRQFE
ncbi:MAG TPA: SMI1/KNR4 family protein [Tepidisphaeraceae bacterium]|jgi:hypothetical protein|nr:SMI1/KNR4 family protein [Tepidisphaeraceae bacterium]